MGLFCLFVCLSVCLFVCLFVTHSTYLFSRSRCCSAMASFASLRASSAFSSTSLACVRTSDNSLTDNLAWVSTVASESFNEAFCVRTRCNSASSVTACFCMSVVCDAPSVSRFLISLR